MTVNHIETNNKNKYKKPERIRIASIDAPELNTPAAKRSKDALEKKLKGKNLSYSLQTRDTYGRVVADVKLM